jgi:hypothetical protein
VEMFSRSCADASHLGLGLEMSLSSTSNIKSQLNAILGPKAQAYFSTLHQFIAGKLSRSEFDDSVHQSLDTSQLGKFRALRSSSH